LLSRVVGRYGRLDLLLLDEVGYVKIDPRGAELLFQVITEREERASIALATNLPFSEWGSVFTDARLVAAIVDRVTFNAHIIETGTQSYRLGNSKAVSRHLRTRLGRAAVLCQGFPQRGDRSFRVVGPISWERHQPSTSTARQQRAQTAELIMVKISNLRPGESPGPPSVPADDTVRIPRDGGPARPDSAEHKK